MSIGTDPVFDAAVAADGLSRFIIAYQNDTAPVVGSFMFVQRFDAMGNCICNTGDDCSAAGSIPVYTHYSYAHLTTPPDRRYFGDTHFHTGSATQHIWSKFGGDHKGDYTGADQAYEYIANVARFDFASLSEHDLDYTDAGFSAPADVFASASARRNRLTRMRSRVRPWK